MIVKDKFELVYGKTGAVYNILPYTSKTLNAHAIDKGEFQYLLTLANVYGKSKSGQLTSYISERIKSCVVVNLDDYPLPGAVSKDGHPVVNLSYLPGTMISDYSASDVYSMFVYSITLQNYISRKPFDDDMWEHISSYLFLVFIRLFGKKSGLLGSYKDLIPKLRILINLYVNSAMFGKPVTENMIHKFEAQLFTDVSDMDLNFNFSSTVEFIHAINKNKLIPLSENSFSTNIINIAGASSLPLFEDMSRFFATLLACTIPGSTIFSHYWIKVKIDLFNKLVELGVNNLKRG